MANFLPGQVGNFTLNPGDVLQIVSDTPKQFVRTPYYAAFQSGWFKFSLCTAHILYGDYKDLRERVRDILPLARTMTARHSRSGAQPPRLNSAAEAKLTAALTNDENTSVIFTATDQSGRENDDCLDAKIQI